MSKNTAVGRGSPRLTAGSPAPESRFVDAVFGSVVVLRWFVDSAVVSLAVGPSLVDPESLKLLVVPPLVDSV